MPQISSREGVAIAQVAVYGFYFLLALVLFAADGWGANLPWLITIFFCSLRIVGGALGIAAIGNPDPVHLLIGAAICSAIGLSLLLLIPLELLRRVNARCFKHYPRWVETGFAGTLVALHVVVLVALVLGVVGGVNAGNNLVATGIFKVGILLEVATILFIVAFVGILGVLVFTVVNYNRGISRHRALLAAVVLAMPLLTIRLVYSIMGFIVKDRRFSPFFGSLGFYVGLSFIMEVLAVGIFIGGGFVDRARVNKRRRRRSRSRSRSRSGTGTASSHDDT